MVLKQVEEGRRLIEDAPSQAFMREIADLLKRKQEIDARRAAAGLGHASYDQWLADAVELQLMIESVRDDRLAEVERLQQAIAKGLGVEQ
jgi:hypothetical protein